MQENQTVELFTDGACLGNPGPGGYGALLRFGAHEKEMSAGFPDTTNNRMELLAAIEGLSALTRPCRVRLYSDSQYLINGLQKGWAKAWRKNNWRKKDGQPALNADLWERLLTLLERHEVELHWVRGHNGHPENERCDALATAAARAVKEGAASR